MKYQQLPLVTFDSVIAPPNRTQVDNDLVSVAPDVIVIASRHIEEGFELLLEGDVAQVANLIQLWEKGGVLL